MQLINVNHMIFIMAADKKKMHFHYTKFVFLPLQHASQIKYMARLPVLPHTLTTQFCFYYQPAENCWMASDVYSTSVKEIIDRYLCQDIHVYCTFFLS